MSDITAKRTVSRATFICLLAVFLMPLVLASVYYFFPGILPLPASKTHGELITPARPLLQFAANTPKGETISNEYLKGKWTLAYVSDSNCDLYCEASLFKTRQVRLALGENMARVQRLYLLTGGHITGELLTILKEHPRMTVASLQNSIQLSVMETLGKAPLGKIYIIDPLGNVLMRYGRDATSKGILKDLKKLLRASRIG